MFNYPITVLVEAIVNHSESNEKVKYSIHNLFPILEIKVSKKIPMTLVGKTTNIESLFTVYHQIQARQISGVVRRLLRVNTSNKQTWLYLNKQAAFMKILAICEEYNDSPLGPIRLIIISHWLSEFIDWFTQSKKETLR